MTYGPSVLSPRHPILQNQLSGRRQLGQVGGKGQADFIGGFLIHVGVTNHQSPWLNMGYYRDILSFEIQQVSALKFEKLRKKADTTSNTPQYSGVLPRKYCADYGFYSCLNI